MHISLYRKYRPQKFSEIVGQSTAIDILRSSFIEKRLGHAYLLSGPRGCGKTTVARLIAKIINCENPSSDGEPCCVCDSCRAVVSGEHLDVMEIDGASNRGIDQIRELKSHVGLAPFMGGEKVYILDEVHMLTTEAFNALLKTLEEPPSSVMFLFATTEPHKVPVTIRSRCLHMPFHRISTEDIVGKLQLVASSEGFIADNRALWEISRSADGALRDALSLAEQALALGNGEITMQSVLSLFGGSSRGELERWVSLLKTNPAGASVMLKELLDKGVSPERFLDALFPLLRDMWVYSLWGEGSFAGTSLSDEEKQFLRSEAASWRSDQLRRMSGVCTALFPKARWGLRSEVFSGLLLLELLGIIDEQGVTEQVKSVPDEPRLTQQQEPRHQVKMQRVEPQAVGSSTVPRMHLESAGQTLRTGDEASPEPIASSGTSGMPPFFPDVFAALWENDLPLCAAMIGIRISAGESELIFDYSDATPLARATLESPRAKQAIARAFGKTSAENIQQETSKPLYSGEYTPAVSDTMEKMENQTKNVSSTSGMSLSEISAYLGADLLMSKSVASPDILDADDASELADN